MSSVVVSCISLTMYTHSHKRKAACSTSRNQLLVHFLYQTPRQIHLVLATGTNMKNLSARMWKLSPEWPQTPNFMCHLLHTHETTSLIGYRGGIRFNTHTHTHSLFPFAWQHMLLPAVQNITYLINVPQNSRRTKRKWENSVRHAGNIDYCLSIGLPTTCLQYPE